MTNFQTMSNNNHPITPPPELVEQWGHLPADWNTVAPLIAQWGADQELEACCELLNDFNTYHLVELLRAARRPKPPSLKEQALALLDPSNTYGSMTQEDEYRISVAKAEIIRRALEQLDD